MAPAWNLPSTEGGTLSLAQYKGKVVILDFWDTWCPPCKKEIPGFIQLQKEYANKNVQVIGMAFGRDGMGAVQQFVKQYGINYPVVIADDQVSRNYGNITSIPTTFLIDTDGKARAKHVGYTDLGVFKQQVDAMLAD